MNKPELFNHYYGEFQEMAERLESQDWFTSEWKVGTNLNKYRQPYLTLRMKDWDRGIHFENWLTGADLERSTIPVAFHFESSREKTGIPRGKFYEYVLDKGDEVIRKLEGYKVSPKSFQLLVKRAPFAEGKILEVMETEYDRLHLLGPVMRDAIEAVKE